MRSYRLRVYPNGAQRRLLDRWFGATRWLWNTALEIRSEAYRSCGLTAVPDIGALCGRPRLGHHAGGGCAVVAERAFSSHR